MFVFKYGDFAIEMLQKMLHFLNISISIRKWNLIEPLGISFYTFKAISYLVDVYKNKILPEKNIAKLALYISFFPELLAGPIDRATNLLPQINNKSIKFQYAQVIRGMIMMLVGLAIKMIIADRVAILVDTVYSKPDTYAGILLIVATIFFAFQIYADFMACSMIAIGTAKTLGYDIIHNFEQPYLSHSIKEFWRRWHISLSTWFRDYLYIPLGGSHCSKIKKYRNILIVFVVSGLWHGANITYVIWGAVHGIYQIVGDLTLKLREKIKHKLKVNEKTFSYKLWQIVITFMLVTISWIPFRASSFTNLKDIIKSMFIFNPWELTNGTLFKLGLDNINFIIAVIGILVLISYDILKRKRQDLVESVMRQPIMFRWIFYLGITIAIIVIGIYGSNYNTSDFIYAQF